MEFNYENNKSFDPDIEKLQTTWDSTSLGLLKTCPRKYYYQQVMGYVGGQADALDFGIFYHEGLEEYEKAKALGVSHDEAIKIAVKFALKQSYKWTPLKTGETVRTRENLIRSLVWYFDHFENDPAETIILDNGKAAVELSFRMDTQLETPNGEHYIMSGHLDKLVRFADGVFVQDHKTTKMGLTPYYFNQYSPNNQMSLYTLASSVVLKEPAKGVIINAAQVGVTFTRFARHMVYRTKAQLDEWFNAALGYIKRNEQFVEEDNWPMNDTACNMYGGCPFQEICKADPGVRPMLLKSNFKTRKWDPMESR